ncbi:glycosyltransferase [Bacillus salipaludis]|uniref:Glycosyltransferase n=1 Tax=Bacillus salipaludis TaxID=2547811 RepID=A0A4R5VQJ6_9BACI|nr:glycosyltransferase [Bacillus salipaludis]MDQ6598593.1 glycosyltransferase [Bacillus salipaludis]TDK60857.1 glycosyltransferase [Bacillus salipaludis]
MDAEGRKPFVSIIIPVKNEGEHIKNTLESLFNVKTDADYEIIVVDDYSEDGCCTFLDNTPNEKIRMIRTEGLGLANAKNAGADIAKGDIFIFCDAHLFFEDYWIERLIDPIKNGKAAAANPGIADAANPSNIGYGYTWSKDLEPKWNTDRKKDPYPVPLLAGGCMAISKEAYLDVDGFDRGFVVWGHEDEEISFKLWLFGYQCYIVPEVTILHVFRPSAPFELKWDFINYNLMRMALLHLNLVRVAKLSSLIKYSDKEKILDDVLSGNVLEKRALYFKKRKHDDNWFMEKFNISF